MASKKEEAPEDVRLVADVDGALVPPDKVITSRARSTFPKIIGRLPLPAAGLREGMTSLRKWHHQNSAPSRAVL